MRYVFERLKAEMLRSASALLAVIVSNNLVTTSTWSNIALSADLKITICSPIQQRFGYSIFDLLSFVAEGEDDLHSAQDNE